MSWKELRDPIHGWIRLSLDEARLLDADIYLQRLRRVSQDGVVNYVYPSANVTRFEHSLGTMYLASLMSERVINEVNRHSLKTLMDSLGLYDDNVNTLGEYIRLGGLHHDIGHPPLSHVLDSYMAPLIKPDSPLYTLGIGKEHEVAGLLIMGSQQFKDIVSILGIDASVLRLLTFYKLIKRIKLATQYNSPVMEGSNLPEVKVIEGLSDDELLLLESVASVISGGIDADRLDYTLRDLYFTGVGSGSSSIDIARLVNYLHLGKGMLIFDDKAKAFLEGYAIARYSLYKWVYMHHKVLQFNEMIREVFSSIIKLKVAEDLRRAAFNFLNGNPDEKNLDIYTDDYLRTLIIDAYHNGLLDGYLRDYADSIIHRATNMRALWKRDEDYIMMFNLGNAIMLNKFIDENFEKGGLNWVNEFKGRIIDELRAALNCNCRILVSVASFSNDINALIRNSDGSLIPINEASPLIRAIDNAWEQTPHIFIFMDPLELSSAGLNLSRVKSVIVRILTEFTLKPSHH